MKKTVKIIAVVLAVLLVVGSAAVYCAAALIYNSNFDERITTTGRKNYDIEDFPSITRERHTFESDKKQTLVGYLYKSADESIEQRGVIVFAHGFGAGGQRGYMDIFEFAANNGYYVFAYDATANDESEGDAVGGLPQGYIDLDHAISYAQTVDEIKDLPFVLMGYSWGALSVTNVLNYHPEVKAVAALAGCNRSMDLIEYEGCKMAGEKAKLLIPFAALHEFFKYGKYAFSSSLKGFANSDCGIMIVHGDVDMTVPIRYGYDLYYEKYGTDERFEFVKYDDRGHDIMVKSNGKLDEELMSRIIAFFDGNI
ncbi:MAG: alpha/beta fold hydrolase [Oscillospiraceae bacterium]|nr:alpha/beta fold hydrolase [Oscillospiraceae bacterium]MBQ9939043.1 alpha/beta fold hydrolase [Oscillospiraceae bacterium]